MCWYAQKEVFVRNKSIGERVVKSTSSLATCMELQMTTVILIGIWLWMQ
jgi:hypothetical protein